MTISSTNADRHLLDSAMLQGDNLARSVLSEVSGKNGRDEKAIALCFQVTSIHEGEGFEYIGKIVLIGNRFHVAPHLKTNLFHMESIWIRL